MIDKRVRLDIRQLGTPLLLLFALWAVAVLVFHLALTRPKVLEFEDIAGGTGSKQRELIQRTKIVEAREAYLEQLRQTSSDLTVLRSEVLSTREARMVPVELEVEELCNKFNIASDRVSIDNTVLQEEELDRFEMVVPLEGGYANLRRFLQAVEESDAFLVVERVALVEGQEGGVMLQLNITLTTYFDLSEAEKEALRRSSPRRRGRRST